jgi:hypothetical protein
MAGAGKKTFTAGEVLTASDVNTYLMEQSVMVFGGTAARSSAIPTPSEGMVSYRSDIDNIELYNGSSWLGVGGEQFISSGTFTTVSALNLSSVLTDTYKAYRFYLLWKGSNTTDAYLRGRQNTTDYSSSAYYAGGNAGTRLGGTSAYGTQNGGAAFLAGSHNSTNFSSIVTTIYRPSATQMNIHTVGYDDTNVQGYHNSGSVLGMTNFNGFTFFPATGTATGTYTLTGIKF